MVDIKSTDCTSTSWIVLHNSIFLSSTLARWRSPPRCRCCPCWPWASSCRWAPARSGCTRPCSGSGPGKSGHRRLQSGGPKTKPWGRERCCLPERPSSQCPSQNNLWNIKNLTTKLLWYITCLLTTWHCHSSVTLSNFFCLSCAGHAPVVEV